MSASSKKSPRQRSRMPDRAAASSWWKPCLGMLFLIALAGCRDSGFSVADTPNGGDPLIAIPSIRLDTQEIVPNGLARPVGMTVSSDGLICIADQQDARVVVLEADLSLSGVYGSPGDGPGELRRPIVCRADELGVTVFDQVHSRITEFSPEGTVVAVRPIDTAVSTSPAMLADGSLLYLDAEGKFLNFDGGEIGAGTWGELPGEMCELPPPYFLSLFGRVGATSRGERVVVAAQIGCRDTSLVPISVLDQAGAARYVTLEPDENVGLQWGSGSARRRQTMRVAAVAVTEQMVALLGASSGEVAGHRVVTLDLLRGDDLTPVHRYVSVGDGLTMGLVAILADGGVLVVDPEVLLYLSHEDLGLSAN